MKKLALAIAAASMAVTPAMAHERHHGGKWVAPLIGGLIVGALIAGGSRDNSDVTYQGERYYNDDRPRVEYYDSYEYRRHYGDYTHYCVTSQHVDRWGYVYYTRQCQ